MNKYDNICFPTPSCVSALFFLYLCVCVSTFWAKPHTLSFVCLPQLGFVYAAFVLALPRPDVCMFSGAAAHRFLQPGFWLAVQLTVTVKGFSRARLCRCTRVWMCKCCTACVPVPISFLPLMLVPVVCKLLLTDNPLHPAMFFHCIWVNEHVPVLCHIFFLMYPNLIFLCLSYPAVPRFQRWKEEEDDEAEQRSVKCGGVHQLCCFAGMSERRWNAEPLTHRLSNEHCSNV